MLKIQESSNVKKSGWIGAALLTGVTALFTLGFSDSAKPATPAALPDHPTAVHILVLDKHDTDVTKHIEVVPLPEHTRLKPGLLYPDSLKGRIQGQTFLWQRGDLVPDTTHAGAKTQDQKTVAAFRVYWKQVENTEGYDEFRNQIQQGTNVDKSWIPKVFYFDSSLAVIPGYLFIRFK